MQREFGKRTVVRAPLQGAARSAPAPQKQDARDPTHMRRAVLAIGLTVTVVGGLFFVLPKLGQCEGGKGAFGLDWCRLMKATVEGASRGVATGRGMAPAGGR